MAIQQLLSHYQYYTCATLEELDHDVDRERVIGLDACVIVLSAT
jgi:hypothetical protein